MLSKARGIGMTSQRTRERMVARLREKGIRDEAVLAAIAAVPRHIFIEEALASRAYEDTALPIGFEQTISQPFIVARMLEAMGGEWPLGTVLEVGTGCGYQAAVLARLAKEVYSVERIGELLVEDSERPSIVGAAPQRSVLHRQGQVGHHLGAPQDIEHH